MSVESSFSYPSDLNASLPAAGDPRSEGDDHIRGVKSVLKTTLPNVSGAVNASHTELNCAVGVTSAIQTQLNAKAPLASPALTGTPTAPTAAAGTNTTQVATTAFVLTQAMNANLPNQSGKSATPFLKTNGTTADWSAVTASDVGLGNVDNTSDATKNAASVTLTNKTIEAGTFTNGYTEESVSANTGTAYTIDLANGSLQILTLTGNCVFTFPTATAGKGFTVILKQDGTGSRTATWPAAVAWPAGTAPTITSTASKSDKYTFVADGSKWVGSNAGQNYTL